MFAFCANFTFILVAARSTVFRAMFSTSMLEAKENTVEINDFEEDVVKSMLEYIYTGETSDLSERAAELMQIAEKYDLDGLKRDCEHAIACNLTVRFATTIHSTLTLHLPCTVTTRIHE